ncbi:hypothetical protein D3C71_1588170 [compost metagenome]
MINSTTSLRPLTLPATSVAVTDSWRPPSSNACVGVKLQRPSLLAKTASSWISPSWMATILCGSAQPLSVGGVSLMLKVSRSPMAPSLMLSMLGTSGTVVSMTNTKGLLGSLTLPRASAAVTVSWWLPSLSGCLSV